MQFHKNQYAEKINEINRRTKGFQSGFSNLANKEIIADLSKQTNVRHINEKWGYKPIEVTGKFDFGYQFKVQTTKDGVIGYNLVAPFHFVDNDTGINHSIFVNRGFIEEDTNDFLGAHNEDGYLTIRGFLTVPHVTKDAKENHLHSLIADHIDLVDFSKISGINSDLSKNVLLHAINFSTDNESIYPLRDNLSSLNKFNTTPESHGRLSRLFNGITFLTLFSNLYLWVCL